MLWVPKVFVRAVPDTRTVANLLNDDAAVCCTCCNETSATYGTRGADEPSTSHGFSQ
jgi:hypothetical protein